MALGAEGGSGGAWREIAPHNNGGVVPFGAGLKRKSGNHRGYPFLVKRLRIRVLSYILYPFVVPMFFWATPGRKSQEARLCQFIHVWSPVWYTSPKSIASNNQSYPTRYSWPSREWGFVRHLLTYLSLPPAPGSPNETLV